MCFNLNGPNKQTSKPNLLWLGLSSFTIHWFILLMNDGSMEKDEADVARDENSEDDDVAAVPKSQDPLVAIEADVGRTIDVGFAEL